MSFFIPRSQCRWGLNTCRALLRSNYAGKTGAKMPVLSVLPDEGRFQEVNESKLRMRTGVLNPFESIDLNSISPSLGDIRNASAHATYQRQRTMTLGDLLLENRIVFLQGEIHTGNANEVVMKLLYLQSENKRKDINFYINSPGGDVIATLAIYDVMQILNCPVATFCVGQAASGAAVLLAGGTKGKRFCLPHSRVMIHQPYGGVSGPG